jgi:hypothetical protein
MRKFLRIILPIMFLVVSAIYLNSAVFSAWVSGGPPNDYPEAWEYRSIRHFFYGVGFIFIALTIFIALKAKAKRIIIKCATGSLIALILFGWPHFKLFIDIDSCLDQGGRWNKEFHKCEK